jgi:hypothetical protein
VSVPIATDETLALDDLQQPRRPINGLLARRNAVVDADIELALAPEDLSSLRIRADETAGFPAWTSSR